ncbi:RNA-binding protein 39 [Bienertia sinuspersici]
MNVQRALHGRWFTGKMISATYMVYCICFYWHLC